ncbi:MAG: hypothetical protein AAFX05_06385 [Planctomycetota bacterium]
MSAQQDVDALQRWLAEHDADCPICRYALRGLRGGTCPECGGTLTLGVRAPGLRLGPWVAAMVFLALGLGYDSVVVTAIIWQMITGGTQGMPPEVSQLLLALSLLGALCGAGIWGLWRGRAWFFTRPGPGQVVVAAGLFVLTGFVHAAVGLWIVI